MSTKSLYFKIPEYSADSVVRALLRAVPPSWRLVDDSSIHVLYCKVHGRSRHHVARCHIVAAPFVGAFGKEAGHQPPRIKLGYSADCGGTHQHIAPLESLCRSLGLAEYRPGA